MFEELFKFINLKFNHDFVSFHPLKYNYNGEDTYICNRCNTLYFTHYAHNKENFDGGIEIDNTFYEMYYTIDDYDYNYIDYLDLIKCDEQIIKNLVE